MVAIAGGPKAETFGTSFSLYFIVFRSFSFVSFSSIYHLFVVREQYYVDECVQNAIPIETKQATKLRTNNPNPDSCG